VGRRAEGVTARSVVVRGAAARPIS